MPVLATDNFDRADNNSLGANWTTVTPGWDATGFAIASNKAQPQSLSGDDLEIYTGVAIPVDQYAQAKVAVTGTTAGTGVGVALRAAADGSCYSICVSKRSGGEIVVARRLAGNTSYTALANPTVVWTDGDTLRAKIVGNVIVIYQNGVQVEVPVPDSSGSALLTGVPGIVHSTTITSGSVDNFEAGSIEMQSLYVSRRRVAR